ncbi:MAG TPA: HNH endonuclease signature motif containing protein [Anaerolineaceae bacterium]|nr:HNH endonuclease signature motif containing protein [Anaerolineaceae bacterium]
MTTSHKLFILGFSAIILISCALLLPITQSTQTPVTGSSTSVVAAPTENVPASWGKQTKTSGCQVNGPLQDRSCTPGAIFTNVTKSDICHSGYARSVRNVPESEKYQDYAEYGITHHTTGQYEVDHLISLELGGSNDIANLWPEAASPTPGFHEKDELENYLHDQVCSGAVSLQQAQIEISTNWLAVYNVMPKN